MPPSLRPCHPVSPSPSSPLQRIDMPCELVEGLAAVLDGAESDRAVALRPGRVELAQGDDGLPVALLVEGDDGAEAVGIVVFVGAVVHFDEARRLDLAEHHAVVIARAVGADEDEPPPAADADIDLARFEREAFRPEPHRQMLRIGPDLEHQLARGSDDPRQDDLALELPRVEGRPICDALACHASSPLSVT